MSLTTGLNIAYRGMAAAEARINVATQNITNADQPGYTRKSYSPDLITTNAGTVPIRGTISSALNKDMMRALYEDISKAAYSGKRSSYLDYYVQRLGNVGNDFSLSSTMNDFMTNLALLQATPENPAQKTQIVSDADVIAQYLRDTSSNIQTLRTQAEGEIVATINDINASLTRIAELNERIVTSNATDGATLASLEDARASELEALSDSLDFSYYYDGQNRVQIYQSSGQPLLLSKPQLLSYSSIGTINSGITYPGSINPILANGVDITSSVKGGKLGALLELRDTTLVQEQEKFDEFAIQLADNLNAVLNTGASIPPRTTYTGEIGNFGGNAFAGSGIVRVALTDSTGVVQSFTDLNIGALATNNDVVAALNGIAGVSASISADGELIVSSTVPGQGLSFNEMTSSVGASNQGFVDYFGLNNMFMATSAADIKVADYLKQNPNFLALGVLSPNAALLPGNQGIAPGDTSVVKALSSTLSAPVSFNAAGDFAANTLSLSRYADNIVSAAALKADIASDKAGNDQETLNTTFDFVKNDSGVNIDEETARLLELENAYQAAASVIAAIKDLFEDLLLAVRR